MDQEERKKLIIESVKSKGRDFTHSFTAEDVICALSLVPKNTPVVISMDGGVLYNILRINKSNDKNFVELEFFSDERQSLTRG